MRNLHMTWRCLIVTISVGAASADVTINVNPAVEYQTILGWGASSWLPPQITPGLRQEAIREVVNDLGLTRLRLEPPAGNFSNSRRWEWENDNGDPEDTNWSAFHTDSLDQRMMDVILPFKQHVENNGDPFQIYVSPSFFDGGSSGSVPPWLFNNPGEYAEFATSILLYLRNTYGLTADYYCILNEPGNNNPFWETAVARMIKVVGPRLQTLGLPTRIQFPEAVSANTSWSFINALKKDAAIWPYIGLLTYHLYGNNDPHRSKIRDFAISRGIPTGQTEYMNLQMKHLYDDLTLGGVSVWEIYGMGSQIKFYYDRLQRSSSQYWNFRQVLHYVRPGAVRIGATSTDANLQVLAFRKTLQTTVILINGMSSRRAIVNGLEAGDYTVSCNVGSGPAEELGVHHVDSSGTLAVDIPSEAVMTIHPHPGTNQPPLPTLWESDHEYLTLPANSAVLTASATDSELDPMTYSWSLTKQPAGASVVLDTPNSPTTAVSGLTVAGDYAFSVMVGDLTHSVSCEVRLTVFAENKPPVLVELHNRNPVLVTLPDSSTALRADFWDLESDPLTYQWRIVEQPSGAAAFLESPASKTCRVSNMAVPGDYVFEVLVSDPAHTVSEMLTVPVYPLNQAPVIESLSATPQPVCLGESAELAATTYDPDGDVISHWWEVKIAPKGAAPMIVRPGAPITEVTGFTMPGQYVFNLTVVDRTKVTSDQVVFDVTLDTIPPTLICPTVIEPIPVGSDCMTELPDFVALAQVSDNCSVTVTQYPAAGTTLGIGQYLVTLTAVDMGGNQIDCQMPITIADKTPPVVTVLEPILIWPPDHKYRSFMLSDCVASIEDNCDGAIDVNTAGTIMSIYSDEPENARGGGDGDTIDDIIITGRSSFDIRVERQGKGNGRFYNVTFKVTDSSGNDTVSTCRLCIPRNQSSQSTLGDDGPNNGYVVQQQTR